MIRALLIPCALLLLMPAGCTTTPRSYDYETVFMAQRVNMVLSSWHMAADNGLYEFYFDQMTDDAVFLGTDASERWTKTEFMRYAREPFSDGNGWTYEQVEYHVAFNDQRDTAWVDEILENEKYGTMRGTAVLVLDGENWKIAHYSLTFLVPNEKAGEVVELIAKD